MMLPVLAQRADWWIALIQDGKLRTVAIAKMPVLFVYLMRVSVTVLHEVYNKFPTPLCSLMAFFGIELN